MALSTSKNTITLALSNYQPTVDDITFDTIIAIQGNTDIIFDLRNIDATTFFGFQNVIIDFGDGSELQYIAPSIINGKAYSLSQSSVRHTYYQTVTGQVTYNSKVYANYFSQATTKTLSATHNITIKTVPVNLLERNFELLGAQLITSSDGEALPYLTLESDENIVYTTIYNDT